MYCTMLVALSVAVVTGAWLWNTADPPLPPAERWRLRGWFTLLFVAFFAGYLVGHLI